MIQAIVELLIWWKIVTLLFAILGTIISLAPIFIGLSILAKTLNGIIAIINKKLDSNS